MAETIPDHIQRDSAVTEIAKRLAAADPPSPALINRALTLAETILDNEDRSQAVAALAEGLAAADPSNSALIDRALSVAETIPINNQRSTALARIRALTMSSMLDELSRWRLRPLAASIDLLGVFLGNSHDKAIAESIGHAVIDMAIEASALA